MELMRLELILNACNAFVLPNLTITPILYNTILYSFIYIPPQINRVQDASASWPGGYYLILL